MSNPFVNRAFNLQPYDGAAYELAPAFGRKRVFIVAIHGDQFAPPIQGTGPLQRVHVMMVNPGETIEFDSPLSVLGALPEVPRRIAPAYRVGGELPRHATAVRGELLRDEQGRFYERVGEQLHVLHQLASGHHGEILDLQPSVSRWAQAKRSIPWPTTLEVEETPFREVPSLNDAARPRGPDLRRNSSSNSAAPSAQSAYRNLFPEPGQWRLVRWGDFKEILSPQLAHAERLRDSHRLPCCLQIYEVNRAQTLESLAADLLGHDSKADQLLPLTDMTAAKLGVTDLIRTIPQTPRYSRREPGLLLPGDFVFHLRLESDPTKDVPAEVNVQHPRNSDMGKTSGLETVSPDPRVASAPQWKTSIPARYLKPWEFKLSREEALYEMNIEEAGLLRSLFRRLRSFFLGRNEFRRWQVMLWGKAPEEQLWQVRPARGGISQSALRDWARKTLEGAGYDPRNMLLEWEIFWRRKGLS